MPTLIILFMRDTKFKDVHQIITSSSLLCQVDSAHRCNMSVSFALQRQWQSLAISKLLFSFHPSAARQSGEEEMSRFVFLKNMTPWNRIWSKESSKTQKYWYIPYHPCMVYLPHIWLILMVNVGKYTSPMGGMGYTYESNFRSSWPASRVGFVLLGMVLSAAQINIWIMFAVCIR